MLKHLFLVVNTALAPAIAIAQPAKVPPSAAVPQINFADAYKTILGRNLRISEQKLDVEASGERKRQALGAFAPSAAIVLSDSTSRTDSVLNPATGRSEPVEGNARSAVLKGTVNLFNSFSDVSGLRAAQQDIKRSREKLLSERQVAEEEAVTALMTFITRNRQKLIVERIVQLKAESVRIARERFDKGLLPMQEVDKTVIELENSRARLSDAQSNEAEARAQLQALLGDAQVATAWPWKEALVQGSPLDAVPFKIEHRPDWRSAESSLESERYKKRQAFGSLLPALDLDATYGNMDLSSTGRRDWGVVFRVTVPLFDRFTKYTSYRLQGLSEELAELRLERLRRTAPAEVEGLRQRHKAARDSALTREKTAQITERLYTDSQQRFRLGRASANDLANDQSRLLETQLLEIEGWASAHLTFVRLCHGLGGFVAATGSCASDAPSL